MDMLRLGNRHLLNIFLVALLAFGCSETQGKKSLLFESTSKRIVGEGTYFEILKTAKDSLEMWKINSVYSFSTDTMFNITFLDSLICINRDKDRLVGCLLMQHSGKNRISGSDGMTYFFGEMIKKQWYFFVGPFIIIPRSMVDGHDITKPLSYQQLHEIALKEVYGGYLNEKGEINEEWFKYHFENVGMCSECKTREDFQKNIVAGSGAIWSTRDTTKPIIHLSKKEPLP